MTSPRLDWIVVDGSALWWSGDDLETLAWNVGVAGALYAAECRGFERGYLYVPE